MRRDLRFAAYGLVFGYLLSWIGFTSYDEVQAMFMLRSPRLWLAFGLAVAIIAVAVRARCGLAPQKPLHPGILPGAAVFGIGWAICGACPAAAFAQLGEGQLPALLTVTGVFIGAAIYRPPPLAASSAGPEGVAVAEDCPFKRSCALFPHPRGGQRPRLLDQRVLPRRVPPLRPLQHPPRRHRTGAQPPTERAPPRDRRLGS